MFNYEKPTEEKRVSDEMVALIYPQLIQSIIYDKIEDFDLLISKIPFWKIEKNTPDFKQAYYELSSDEFKFATINNDAMKKIISQEFALVQNSIGYSINSTILNSILENKEYALYEHIHKNNENCSKEHFIGFVILLSDLRFEPHMKFFQKIVKDDTYKEVFKELITHKNNRLLGTSRFDKDFHSALSHLKKLLPEKDLKEVFTNNLTYLGKQNYPYLNLEIVNFVAEQNLIDLDDFHLRYMKSKIKPNDLPKYEKLFLNQKISDNNTKHKQVKL